ncbi:MAG: NAD(P)/FAD-dependent oxidoreductase [Firmicutes bacterium]|uniref:Ferredoxin--NADP reductase n=1 Tax=Sulfobacillus benefaciens TaxID=453960 RepID=A0A2T2WT37_9FIRM|nr:NAD(P)/FAD-dependent oxidoreductase [Bacillota bacterium]MCL5012484.1 NAD(P)/FAD-dependent oxidoreductase [Bacillota bacterium]PSR25363.1 MAG: NAD(P)/FAD-dependent oxidoreductase [Sulfobacillus benefaciens]
MEAVFTEVFDVTIVGGGPVGLFGATLASLHGMKVKIIESLPELGGQLYALYPEKPVYDVAGFPEITAKDLALNLIAQMERIHPEVVLQESVESVESLEDGTFVLHTPRADHYSRTILLAVGIGSFTPRRLPAQRADMFEGKGLHYFVPPLDVFTGQHVLVVGGGDTAVDWALAVSKKAQRVSIVHRRNDFRAQQDSVRQLYDTPNISIITPAEVEEIFGHQQVTGVRVKHHEVGGSELAVDAIIGGLGFHPDLGPVKSWGIELKGSTIKVSLDSMLTSREGIWAVGDAVYYPGKVKLIATGFGEVGIAVAQIRSYLHPGVTGLPHSTTLKNKQR